MTIEEDFAEFAQASTGRLRRAAILLCGDWHSAEDLTQSALAKVFVSWRKIRQRDSAHAYAMRTLVNTYLADRRLKRPPEILTSSLPEAPSDSPEPETKIVLLAALAALPPGARAIVMLRYWEDMSVDQVAALLGCSAGNVKSQSNRALDKLRAALGSALEEAFHE